MANLETPNVKITESFDKITLKFNNNFLLWLQQLSMVFRGEEETQYKKQFELFKKVYQRDYLILKEENPLDSSISTRFYTVCNMYHDLIMSRSETLFDTKPDLFSQIFNVEGFDCKLLYDSLGDELDETEDMKLDDILKKAKQNFWSSLFSLYQLSVILNLYFGNEFIREIIDLIHFLPNKNNVSKENLINNIMGGIMSSKDSSKRKKFMKLMKRMATQDEEKFEDVYTLLKQVLEVFSKDINLPLKMNNQTPDLEMVKNNLENMENVFLKQIKSICPDVTDEGAKEILTYCSSGDEQGMEILIQGDILTREQYTTLKKFFSENKLGEKAKLIQTVSGLSGVMDTLMNTMKNPENMEEEKLQEMVGNISSQIGIDVNQLSQMEKLIENFEETEDE